MKGFSWKPAIWLIALLTGIFIAVWIAPSNSLVTEGFSSYLPLHTLLETVSVVIAALIFGIGWNAYSDERPGNVVLLACAFLGVAVLDVGHFMSFKGMPDLITLNSTNKGVDFWLFARLLAASALLAAAMLPWKPFSGRYTRHVLLLSVLLYTGTAYWLTLSHPDWLPRVFIDGEGLTSFKVGFEYLIILLLLVTAAALLLRIDRFEDHLVQELFIALVTMALSELCFTLYSNVADVFNVLGHSYKIIAYIFLYRAIFISSVHEPFKRLQETERKLFAEKELAEITLTSIGDAVITTNLHGHVQYLNPIAEKLTGWNNREAFGQPVEQVFKIVNETSRHTAENPAHRAIAEGVIVGLANHTVLICRDGTEYNIEDSAAPIRDHDGNILGCVLVFHDVTDKHGLLEQLSWRAGHDVLTSLPNRAILDDRLEQALAHAKREQQLLLVCFMDLDGFKPVNDRYGHELGDRLLVEVARRLVGSVRGNDTVARLGGDEFVLLLNDIQSTDEIDPMLTRLLKEVSLPYQLGAETIEIGASIGVTIYPLDENEPDTLLRHADQAMYHAKQGGRGCFHMFDTEMDEQIQQRHQLLNRIEQALRDDELRLFYQPKINLRSGEIIGMEALLRWQHPERGLLGPMEFLPLAEQSDLIIDIGDWVIRHALQQLEIWCREGRCWGISVNIAARHLQRPDFIATVQDALALHPTVPAQYLELEILESSAIEDMTHVRQVIAAGQSLGLKFSLDDFGSGYSSLAYMRLLPVDTLKIDQSFVRDILQDEEDRALVEGILKIAEIFKLNVLAEGMETAEHGVLLTQMGCTQAQGYGIARPMPAGQVPEWAAQFKPDARWRNSDLYSPLSHKWEMATPESSTPEGSLF